ncbi:LexA family protein [Niastella populi]|uniref:Peptidase S24 n=1 Tax=Niastella populi TaxID=550983 RepID=A0A1V9EVA8_9BACT|nr:translesion error-prone DNA polymerase V autoproteolytic subunit [Niastella populi]OQP49844.1 peptidase S24 [Niastella populi]
MEGEFFNETSNRGTKKFPQQDVKTADATGIGAAADDYMEGGIDLNEQLIRNKPATFFLRMRGDAMTGAGIFDGDTIIVDRSLKAESGKIVVASLNGEMLIRRLEKTFNKVRLISESRKNAPIEVDASCDSLGIWGVVTYSIHAI